MSSRTCSHWPLLLLLLAWSAVEARQTISPFRIAVVVAWIGGGHVPASTHYFLSSVAANANLLDLLLFHENNNHLGDFIGDRDYPNVYLHNLGKSGLGELAARKMGSKLSLSGTDIAHLAAYLKEMYREKPKWTLEIRPAYGSIFEDYLDGYTHWLYMDMDEILGDIPAWLELEELMDFHIVTLATGDSHRVYLRGPFTMVNMTHEFPSLIWTRCSYLTARNIVKYAQFKTEACLKKQSVPELEDFAKQMNWKCRILPDEAEFSERVITTPGIYLKIASKSLADPIANKLTDVSANEIFWVDGAVRFCTGGLVCDPTRPSAFRRRMLNVEGRDSVAMPLTVDPSFPGMRLKKGPRQRVLLPRKDGGACKMVWTQPWGRCLRTSDRRFDLYLIDKFWWKQEFAFAEEEQQSAVSERMIVHFRSWKHYWGKLGNDVPLPPEVGGGHFVFTRNRIVNFE